MGTTINMDESDYIALRDKLAAAHTETAQAKDQLALERERGFDERLAEMTKFIRASKEVTDFAVANLSPEWCRGWPHESLATMIELVDKIGNPTSNDQERVIIWRQFHENIVDFDRRWALASLTSAVGTSPSPLAVPQPESPVALPEEKPSWTFNLIVVGIVLLLLLIGVGTGLMIAAA